MRKMLVNALKALINLVEDEDSCPMTPEDIERTSNAIQDIMVRHHLWSKYKSYTFLGISRSQFDRLIQAGSLPKGMKIAGFKELFWDEREIRMAANKRKEAHKR